MAKKAIFVEADIWNQLEKAVNPIFVDAKSFKVVLGMECKDDKIYKMIDEDPLLLMELTEIASDQYKDIVKEMISALEDAEDKGFKDATKPSLTKITKDLDATFEKLASDAEKSVAKDAANAIKKFNKLNKDVTIDMAKLAFTVATTVTGLTFSLVSLVTTPFTAGVGGVIGLIGMARGIASLAALIADRAKDVDKLIIDVRKDLKDLAKNFEDNVKEARAKDLAKEAFNAVVFPADVLKSSKSLEKQVGLIQEKLRKMEVETHALAKNISRMMAACDKGEKEIDKMLSESSNRKDILVKLGKAQDSLAKSQQKLHLTLEKIGDGQVKVKSCTEEADELEATLKEITDKKSKAEKVAETLLRLAADMVASGLSADFGQAADIASFTIDAVAGVKDVIEDLA